MLSVHAMSRPSGEYDALVLLPLRPEIRNDFPPFAGTTYTSGPVPAFQLVNSSSEPSGDHDGDCAIERSCVSAVSPAPSWSITHSSLSRPSRTTNAMRVDATPGSPVNCSTTSSANRWTSERQSDAGPA